jgi:hypothetical protein
MRRATIVRFAVSVKTVGRTFLEADVPANSSEPAEVFGDERERPDPGVQAGPDRIIRAGAVDVCRRSRSLGAGGTLAVAALGGHRSVISNWSTNA